MFFEISRGPSTNYYEIGIYSLVVVGGRASGLGLYSPALYSHVRLDNKLSPTQCNNTQME